MSFAVACVSLAASAQGYVGGSVGIASSKIGNSENVTTYQVLPEVGINLDENWAIGTVVGWVKVTLLTSRARTQLTTTSSWSHTFVTLSHVASM